MNEESWREVWPTFRVNLVNETARCLADQESAATGGQRSRWDDFSSAQQDNLVENIARIFIAQDQAMENIIERGLAP